MFCFHGFNSKVHAFLQSVQKILHFCIVYLISLVWPYQITVITVQAFHSQSFQKYSISHLHHNSYIPFCFKVKNLDLPTTYQNHSFRTFLSVCLLDFFLKQDDSIYTYLQPCELSIPFSQLLTCNSCPFS